MKFTLTLYNNTVTTVAMQVPSKYTHSISLFYDSKTVKGFLDEMGIEYYPYGLGYLLITDEDVDLLKLTLEQDLDIYKFVQIMVTPCRRSFNTMMPNFQYK